VHGQLCVKEREDIGKLQGRRIRIGREVAVRAGTL
jgi:hypothetical protein